MDSHWVGRLSAAAGALASVALAPTAGKAAVVKVTAQPVSLSTGAADGSTVYWDIDGANGNDFRLNALRSFGNRLRFDNDNGALNGQGFAAGYSASFSTTQIRSTYTYSGKTYTFTNTYTNTNIIYYVRPLAVGDPVNGSQYFVDFLPAVATGSGIGGDFQRFQLGDNFFGFSFAGTGGTHYGYGVLNYTRNGSSMVVTISKWAYEDVANAALTVEAFPAASAVPGPIGLAGLAAGAAWTRKLRRRIRESQSE